jgi:endonuclease-3
LTKKEKRERLALIIERLKEIYPDAECALEYGGDPWRLLVMARLSAQCTDARVNIVAKELFDVFPTARDMAVGELSRIEEIVKPCGLYRMKAKNIKECAEIISEKYEGGIPDNMEELLPLPGVGRKIANLLLGDIYKKPAVVVDTHCIRISARMGLVPKSANTPEKIERILSELIKDDEQSDFCHRIVQFGRDVCIARSPKCDECILADLCRGKRTNQKK